MTEPLRWGAIGASWIAQDWVLPAIRETGADIVAVYSHDPARATEYAARNDIPTASGDLAAFLADPGIDAVYISSKTRFHHDQTLAAAAAGKAILCEKAMATNVADAVEMVDAADRSGVVLAVNHHMRNAPTLRAMRQLVQDGAIGRPLAVRVNHAILLPEFLRTWRVDSPEDGGAIFDLTSHDADNLRFLLDDEVEDVMAVATEQRFSANGVADSIMGVMRFAGGVVASFHDAYAIGSTPTAIEIHGTDGSVIGTEVLRQGPVGEVVLRRGEEETAIDVGERESLYGRGVRLFTEAVRGDGRPPASGEDGLRAVAVSAAVAESAATGRRVTVAYR